MSIINLTKADSKMKNAEERRQNTEVAAVQSCLIFIYFAFRTATPQLKNEQLYFKVKPLIFYTKSRNYQIKPTNFEIRNDKINAFFRFPVAKYTGTETAIPSGILWIAIATVIATSGDFRQIPREKMVKNPFSSAIK